MKIRTEEIESSCLQREGKYNDNYGEYEVEENCGFLNFVLGYGDMSGPKSGCEANNCVEN